MDALFQQVGGMLGTTAKATIFLQDDRGKSEQQLKEEAMAKANASPLGVAGLSGTDTLKKMAKSAYSMTDMVGGALSTLTGTYAQAPPDSSYNKAMTVQFNPNSIHLRSNAGDDDVQINSYTQDATVRGIGHGSMDIHVEMSVKLIFDQTNNITSFQQDMLDPSISQKAGQIFTSVNQAVGKMPSVQVITEGFVAALRNPRSRMVCFSWGELQYEGMLRQVNTTYTMFNISGAPTRSEVELMIYLVEMNGSALADYTNGYWYDAYYKAFIKGNPLAEALIDEGVVDTV